MTKKTKTLLENFYTGVIAISFTFLLVGVFAFTAWNWEDDNASDVNHLIKVSDNLSIELPEEYQAIESGDKLLVIKRQEDGNTIIQLAFSPNPKTN